MLCTYCCSKEQRSMPSVGCCCDNLTSVSRGGVEHGMQPINGAQTYAIAHFFLFLVVAPRGGVTGRPAFRPPYANFRLSAGWQQNKTAEKLFISIRNTEGHGHTALDKMKKNFTTYSIQWCEFNIANPRAVIPVYLLYRTVWMYNNTTLYQENKL